MKIEIIIYFVLIILSLLTFLTSNKPNRRFIASGVTGIAFFYLYMKGYIIIAYTVPMELIWTIYIVSGVFIVSGVVIEMISISKKIKRHKNYKAWMLYRKERSESFRRILANSRVGTSN